MTSGGERTPCQSLDERTSELQAIEPYLTQPLALLIVFRIQLFAKGPRSAAGGSRLDAYRQTGKLMRSRESPNGEIVETLKEGDK